jgi:hypothetical protein
MKQFIRSCTVMVIITFIISCVKLPVIYGVEPSAQSAPNTSGAAVQIAAPTNNASAAPLAAPAGSNVAIPSAASAETFPIFFTERIIKGDNSREEAFFEIGKSRKVLPGSFIDIYYGHSPALLPKTSTLTVFMDDVPISSVLLDETNREKAHWRIDISKYLVNSGFHKLSFMAHMEIANNVCVDPNNEATWMVINKESTINLNLGKSYANADLTWYPSPFLEKGSQQPLQSILVVPDDIEQAEFTAAARLVQFFSAQSQSNRLNVPIYAESDLTDTLLRDNNIIWLGRTGHWKERGQLIEDTYRKQADPAIQGQGFISVGISPWNAELSGLVVSGTADELKNGVSILTDESLYSQLLGKAAAIPAALKKQETPNEFTHGSSYTVSFEKMGYNNITVGGKTQGSTVINYSLPIYSDIEDGAKLTLAFKHSKSIYLGQSVISVKLNGTPVDSHKLSEASSDDGLIEVDFKQDLIGIKRTLDIEVIFEFVNSNSNNAQIQKEACMNPNPIGNWAVIDKASTLTYTPVERKSFNLQSIPYSFIVNGRWNEATFLVPDKFGTKELNIAMTLVGILGKNALDNSDLSLTKTSAAGLKDLLRTRNVVYLGTAKDLPDFMNGFPDSSVQFKDDKMISLTKNVELLSELQSRSAVIQLSRSPLNENKTLLVLAATSADRESSISDVLTSPVESAKITGKFVVIDSQNKVHAFAEEPAPLKAVAKAKPTSINNFLNGQDKFGLDGSVFVLAFVVMMALVAGIVWLAQKRR